MNDIRIVVVGSTNTDMMVRSDRLPMPGETVLGDNLIMTPGGKGANQAVAAARLGAKVVFIARVGRDIFGRQTLEHFRRENLDIRHVLEDTDAPSGVALIMVGPDGQNMISVAQGANARLSPADIEAAASAFTHAQWVILQLETPISTVVKSAQLARASGARVILNPAPVPAEPIPAELYGLIDLMTPNETESQLLTGESSPESAAEVLLDRGVGTVIVTLGKDGVLLAERFARMQHIAGFRVQAVDATAAGDCFNGGLAYTLAQGLPLPEAIRFAQAAAALSVTRSGAQSSLPTQNEVRAFLTE